MDIELQKALLENVSKHPRFKNNLQLRMKYAEVKEDLEWYIIINDLEKVVEALKEKLMNRSHRITELELALGNLEVKDGKRTEVSGTKEYPL